MALATIRIQIDAAAGAEPLAVFPAKDLHRDLQQDLLGDQRIEIDQIILVIDKIQVFRAEFLFLRMLRLRRRQDVFEGGADGQPGGFETTGTAHFHLRAEAPFKVQGLTDPFQGSGYVDPIERKSRIFFFREDLPRPGFILEKLNVQALFRYVHHIDLQPIPAVSGSNPRF